MALDLRDSFAFVLANYVDARSNERIGKASPTWQRLMAIRDALAAAEPIRRRPSITVRASAGQGSWARIPWVALLHSDATDTTRRGIYVIYLFRADMSGVYLTINQGVTEPIQRLGVLPGLIWVRERAQTLRQPVGELVEHGFELTQPLDLCTDYPSAQHYVASTIAHKLYARAELPANELILDDLANALATYESVLRAGSR